MSQGSFIMIDGIDGSGKSTIIKAWHDHLETEGKRVFSIRDYWDAHGAHPLPIDALDYDVILSAEPTYVWTGAAIRQEMIRVDTAYDPHAVAAAYALDRLILYTRFLLPLRSKGKTIIQDRGVSTSLCYQPIQGNISREDIAALEGNKFALSHAPDILFLTHIDPKTALARLDRRSEKQDNAVFEKASFLEAAHQAFHSNEYQQYFTSHGSTVIPLNTDVDEYTMKQNAITLLEQHLSR